ncbi:tRNA modification GTPase [Candidatus Carsonella ruddii HT isolate Thao2000]|uniref:tRNA modification GTPase n=1 Tax=Candidatus Carsonella ruddii HT isolate Thao2000 TaxID=1202539 RepID=J3YQ84_CARRU|nr:GTPase [Candidatus Carsonella ruddii]AFP84048.1 tRNA modification GTPase [Candidatus Carsonella ruddii HT isolate Thao2000]
MNNIFAKITADGVCAVNIIKLSGKKINNFIFPLIKKKLIPQKMTYTNLYGIRFNYIEKILIVYFKSPNSFTGEDLIEFHLNGNYCLLNKLIKDLIFLGAVPAKPGEFLERRYSNGKITLFECEIINDKILYNYKNMFNLTMEKQKNFYLSIIKNLKFKFNIIIICLEIINIYSKNSIKKDFIFIKNFFKKIKNLISILQKKIEKIDYLKNKFEIIILGRRNVGKSTLFNKLCLQYNSIVTNIPGTTKNNINKKIFFSSKKININDTAGLKIKSKNLIEKIGILKNINKIFKSSLILYIFDEFNLKKNFYNAPLNIYEKIIQNKIIILINKCDLFGVKEGIFKLNNLIVIFIITNNSKIINKIKCFISKIIDNEKVLINAKFCYTNIQLLLENCNIFYKNLFFSYDLISENIIRFQKNIYKLTGEYINESTINSLFRNFCVGK